MKKEVENEVMLAMAGHALGCGGQLWAAAMVNTVTSIPALPTFNPSKPGSQEAQAWPFNFSTVHLKKKICPQAISSIGFQNI